MIRRETEPCAHTLTRGGGSIRRAPALHFEGTQASPVVASASDRGAGADVWVGLLGAERRIGEMLEAGKEERASSSSSRLMSRRPCSRHP